MDKYILEGQKPVQCKDIHGWAKWMENADRVVKQEAYKGFYISTVFLGIDHAFSLGSSPKLFETMIFPEKGKWNDLWMERCSTWNEAIKMHERAKKVIDNGEVKK